MKWGLLVSRRHLASPPFRRLGLLAFANLLAAIGGGRVLSAGKGVTSLTFLGSGSLLAFLAGSALGLGLLVAVRRSPLGWALVGLSIATVLSSLTLIAILWFDSVFKANDGTLAVWDTGTVTLSGAAAWFFFPGLVAGYALWFACRSLRSDLAASLKMSGLAFTESGYFLGFIIGLLMGPVSVAGHRNVVGALLLDVLLLSIVAGCDLFQRRGVSPGRKQTNSRHLSKSAALGRISFWRLTAAFCASTIACQVVIFHFADVLARTAVPTRPAWSDVMVATFYLGVAVAAAFCAWSGPAFEPADHQVPGLVLRWARRTLCIPLLPFVTLVAILILLGILGINSTIGETGLPSPWSMGGALSLAALGGGAGLFEILVLAVVGRIRFGGNGSVALAFGLAATSAAIALFLMMLSGMRFPGWVVTTVMGLALAAWLVRRVKIPHEM